MTYQHALAMRRMSPASKSGRIIGSAATGLYLFAWLILSVGGGLLMETLLG
jgi:hypothetical protein